MKSKVSDGAEENAPLIIADVYKHFGPTIALDGATLSIQRGEIHGLLGENGSGKSTLIKVASGVLKPDKGKVFLQGRELGQRSPREAMSFGVGCVYQEILVCGALSILENVLVGSRPLWNLRVIDEKSRERIRELIRALSGEDLPLAAPVERLPLGLQQVVCIARALYREPQVLILDEATSALDVEMRDNVFEAVRRWLGGTKGALFVSHRMDELATFVDRVTVLRSGKTVGTLRQQEAKADQLLELMSGRERVVARLDRGDKAAKPEVIDIGGRDRSQTEAIQRRGTLSEPNTGNSRWVFELIGNEGNLNKTSATDETSAMWGEFRLKPGDLVGLGGLEGNGQERFLKILAGLERSKGANVAIHENGQVHVIRGYRQAVRNGVVYVPRDRKTEGAFLDLPLLDNFALPALRTFGGRQGKRKQYLRFTRELHLGETDPTMRMRSLSGGTQQKVILARWLEFNPKIMLLNDPTRGVDAPTKREIYDLLTKLVASEKAVVLLSTELEELVTLCSKVVVFERGRIVGECQGKDINNENILSLMFGGVRDVVGGG